MEDTTSELEDKSFEITPLVENKIMKKGEEILCDLWDFIKRTNMRIIAILKGEEREWGAEILFRDIIAEKLSTWG